MEVSYKEKARAEKALTEFYECDLCHAAFQDREKAVVHIVKKHI